MISFTSIDSPEQHAPSPTSLYLHILHQGPICVNTCVKKEVGLSTNCTACFGTFGVCVATNCLGSCLDPAKALECGECTVSNCLPALNSCTKPIVWTVNLPTAAAPAPAPTPTQLNAAGMGSPVSAAMAGLVVVVLGTVLY